MFEFKNVTYKDILHIKSLSIQEHAITSIVGQSGSGKTTFLRLLNKLNSYDQGEIRYRNKPLDQLNSIELRREVVMLPQTPAIFNGSIKENLLIGLTFSEKPSVSDEKLLEILELIQLKKELHQDTDKLSGGEKQRIALGRMILMEPEVLLLDEPSSALDDVTENIIIEALVNYTKRNRKTMVMVTHSRSIARQFSDVIIEINKDQIIDQKGES
ncbi:MAG: ATP-binding cassette domain-containing protein [Tindallia sp. MSAO_Bac2]|nr:MAG: ATP-binding cassette domain-containing protein [Tindallia sp. MSAO_Bac2]